MTHLNLGADEDLTTTRAVRKRLDPERPLALQADLFGAIPPAVWSFELAPRKSLDGVYHVDGW